MLANPSTDRLPRLLAFLEGDPDNPRLLADAAEAAYEISDLERAGTLLARLQGLGAASAQDRNLAALVALRLGRLEEAIAAFESLAADDPTDGGLRFNLAWANVLAERYEAALAWLDDAALAASPHAAPLKVQALHHLGRLDDALAFGRAASARQSDDTALNAALAIVALDAEDIDAARAYALRAGNQADGQAALGMLALTEEDEAAADTAFESALATQPDNARAWIGKGLVALGRQDAAAAAKALEQGATIFRSHVGSWVAAGWAHFAAGQNDAARRSFDMALVANPKFSEGHGGLAVLAIAAGEQAQAREHIKLALRLDPQSFGGRLAQVLLLEQEGHADRAAAIRRQALDTPVGPGGSTIAQALAAIARRR